MERQRYYKVYDGKRLVKEVVAHSKWEAIERVHSELIMVNPRFQRNRLRINRLK